MPVASKHIQKFVQEHVLPDNQRSSRLAVLIDADNASFTIADGLFDEIAKIGEASVRRIYGDFAKPNANGWADILARHAIIPHHQPSYTRGKNSADIALVIDAMDVLHSGNVDGFCLVSSDSDFTRLASRIREQGLGVYGFGEQKTPESFRRACRRFIYTENLRPDAPGNNDETAGKAKALQPPSKAIPQLRKIVTQLEDENGWASLSGVGSQLFNQSPDFDPRTFGFTKLSDLVRKTGFFEVEQEPGGSIRIRLKSQPEAKR